MSECVDFLGPWNPFKASLERDFTCGFQEQLNASLAFYPELLRKVSWHCVASFPSKLFLLAQSVSANTSFAFKTLNH